MDHALLEQVDLWLAEHRQQIVSDLLGLVRIPSVSVPDEVVPPYGQACRDAIDYMLQLGQRHGYATHNYDNYVGAISFSRGAQEVGVWSHLDVVPVPDPAEWDYPPFEGVIVEDRYLIGRGVQDNKMTAIGVFHAMNCLRDLGVPLRHGYTLYMGTSEETGMEDVQYFRRHYPCPDVSLVPDAGFPVCCAQRGCLRLGVSIPFPHALDVCHSNNPSVTPEVISARLPDGTLLSARGASDFVYRPVHGDNAVLKLLHLLQAHYPEQAGAIGDLLRLVSPCDGAGLDIRMEDELSGPLMMSATGLQWSEGRLEATVYVILPVSFDTDALWQSALRCADARDAHLRQLSLRPPCSFPTAHPLVTRLTDVYNKVMGQSSQPYVMSGGNYAAYLPNAFAYGPGMPGRTFPPHIFRKGRGDYHQCDESEDVEHILNFMRVYAMAICSLNEMENLQP